MVWRCIEMNVGGRADRLDSAEDERCPWKYHRYAVIALVEGLLSFVQVPCGYMRGQCFSINWADIFRDDGMSPLQPRDAMPNAPV